MSPSEEEKVKDQWYAAIYKIKGIKKSKLFIVKAKQRILEDDNGIAEYLQLDCLKPGIDKDTKCEIPKHLERDISLFNIEDIIADPLNGLYVGDLKWCFTEYLRVIKMFVIISKLDGVSEYNEIYRN